MKHVPLLVPTATLEVLQHPTRMTLQVLAIVVLGLMCGSELNIAAFAHPILDRQATDVHIPVRAGFATLLGRVMPFWMSTSTLLNLLLLFPFAHLGVLATRLAQIAFAIQVFAVLFSLAGPVPINNRIKLWTPTNLPADWQAQERRWDVYHWSRTIALILAFLLLVVGALH
ncbi:MAG TPA: DUF1772 domain-containing protein [Acidobacteriaceae bacterium]